MVSKGCGRASERDSREHDHGTQTRFNNLDCDWIVLVQEINEEKQRRMMEVARFLQIK